MNLLLIIITINLYKSICLPELLHYFDYKDDFTENKEFNKLVIF